MRLRAEGAEIRPQVSPRPLLCRLKLSATMQFMGLDALDAFANAPVERKRELVGDESWRERARAEWVSERRAMFPRHALQDIAIIDLDELEYMPQQLAPEPIAGEAHFTWPAKGISPTIVDGVPTQIDGVLTGERPARFPPSVA